MEKLCAGKCNIILFAVLEELQASISLFFIQELLIWEILYLNMKS